MVFKHQCTKIILNKHPDLQSTTQSLEELLMEIGRLDAKLAGPCSQEEALRRGVQRFMYYNEGDFRKAAQATEVPDKTSTKTSAQPVLLRPEGSQSQSQRLEAVREFYKAKHTVDATDISDEVLHRRHEKKVQREELNSSKETPAQTDKHKREWDPVLFSGKNSGVKTRITRDVRGRQHYQDYDSLKYKRSPFKTKTFNESSKQSLPASFSSEVWEGGQKTLLYDVARSREFGNEHWHGSVGFTPYASAKGQAKVKHTKDAVSVNASGNAGFGVNVGTVSINTQHVTAQGDVNVLSGQADGNISFDVRQDERVDAHMNVQLKAELFESNINTQLQMPLFNAQCDIDGYLGMGASAKFTVGYSSYKTKSGGSVYIKPQVNIAIGGDYNVGCKPIN